MDFNELRNKLHTQKPNPNGYESILAFDPGHTTGWASYFEGELTDSGQIDCHSIPLCVENARDLISTYDPTIIVMEDYRIYKSHQKQHVGSDMLTTRVIGSIETLAYLNGIEEIYKQGAGIAKGFCTDEKLKAWNYYKIGRRHARDAIRHGCYYILFGHRDGKKPGTNTTTMGN